MNVLPGAFEICFPRGAGEAPSWKGYKSKTNNSTDKRAFTREVPQKLTASLPFYLQITNSNRRWIGYRGVSEFGRFTTATAEGGRKLWHSNHAHFSQCLWCAKTV